MLQGWLPRFLASEIRILLSLCRLHARTLDEDRDGMFSTNSDRLHWVQCRARLPVRHSAFPIPQVRVDVAIGGRGRGCRQVASRDCHVVRNGGTFAVYRRNPGCEVWRFLSHLRRCLNHFDILTSRVIQNDATVARIFSTILALSVKQTSKTGTAHKSRYSDFYLTQRDLACLSVDQPSCQVADRSVYLKINKLELSWELFKAR